MNNNRVLEAFRLAYDSSEKTTEMIEVFGILDAVISEWRELKHKTEKYKLHDITLDPEDLPDGEGLIIVYLTGYAHNCQYDNAVDMVYWCDDGKFFEDAAMNQLVRGWRHIPMRWE